MGDQIVMKLKIWRSGGTTRITLRTGLFCALILLAVAQGGFVAMANRATAAAQSRPNIVFIMADDLGWADLGAFGAKYYETPNIDRLAQQGMKLTSYYVYQNCTPTRAALMSGQLAPRTGMYTVGTLERGEAQYRRMLIPQNVTQLPLDRVTVADSLKVAGYATGIFGKWHLGEQGDYHPSKRGFDEAIVSMGRHYDFETLPKVDVPHGAYLADFLTDRAVRFIEKHKDRPFFLYLPHFGVHVPLEAKAELIEKFKKRQPVGGHNNPVYAAMIASIDESVGRVMAKLDELRLAENTIVIFTSDNGGVGGYNAAGIKARDNTDNAPLRAGKGTLYEGGVRVPFIVRWPVVVKPGAASNQPVMHVDVFPTFLGLAGVKEKPKQSLDGVSFAPLLKDAKALLKRDALYWHFPGYLEGGGPGAWRTTPVGTVRSGDWKLLEFFEDGRLELYNLKDDLGEKNNLAAKMPGKTRELHAKLKAWRQSLNAPMPKPKSEPTTNP
jgi:arylsulfatase A-like enzyme